jgi:hypothetical protein
MQHSPDGIDVNVVENSDNCVHITMPALPDGHMNLSDEELGAAAGGGLHVCGLSGLKKIFPLPNGMFVNSRGEDV